jgi:cytosine/adenosine deaminase-related metal-dependent hydrolase
MVKQTIVWKQIDWLVAWDSAQEKQVYLRKADLVVRGNLIGFVGWNYEGPADRILDGSGLMVLPGLINLHSHPWSETLHKGYIEDFGNPALGMMAMYNMMPGWVKDYEAWQTCATVAYCELLTSGVTTLVDISPPYPGWLDLLAASGLRGVVAPSMASARWCLSPANKLDYDWYPDQGTAGFNQALGIIDQALNHPCHRLGAMVFPAQVDTCTASFLHQAQAAARERGIPLQTHAAQSLPEFEVMIGRHGKSPIAWLEEIGLLTPELTLGHGIFLDSHSWIKAKSPFPGSPQKPAPNDDLKRLADNQVSVAHSPTVFLRTAAGLEHFTKYRQAGVNVALATDTFPNNMLEEVRLVGHLGRVQARSLQGSLTADLFDAATIGGARALLRSDLGRLAPGCQADFFTVALDHPLMQPLRDPLRSLIHTAAERAVRDVYVAGELVVRQGKVVTLDYDRAVAKLTQLSQRNARKLPSHDPQHPSADILMPLALEMRSPPSEMPQS